MGENHETQEKADLTERRLAKIELAEEGRRVADSEVAAHAYKLRQFIEELSAAQ
ncbi:hypothetical protein [Pseudomonas veronii]|uniref:hypothetical protein n=1 Tax=Pseudomonas veronii TaxID=76761 RepID=UPI0012E15272|nr:hypothetical protein [Pseudomonas veronii]